MQSPEQVESRGATPAVGSPRPPVVGDPTLGAVGPAAPVHPPYNVPPVPISVLTPASNSQIFQSSVYRRQAHPSLMGTGAQGVDFITRIQMALRSKVESEVTWAVQASLEVSNRQADTLKDPSNRAIVSLLLRLVLERWPSVISGAGLFDQDTDSNADSRALVAEALLTLRNLALDPTGAQILGRLPGLKTALENGLGLPEVPSYFELRTYALELTENVGIYLGADSDSVLFSKLIGLIDSEDRSTVISAQRALSRLSVSNERNSILEISNHQIQMVLEYLLVDDEDLISSSLDLLYQYTRRVQRISDIVGQAEESSSIWIQDILSTHLIRLLTYKMTREQPDYIRLPRRTKRPAPAEPPKLTPEILQELVRLKEPERATNWIRASYEPDPDGEVRQISLWKAYESQFDGATWMGPRLVLLPALDFIRNVSTAFRNAAAMVVNLPSGEKNFIIKGIKPREAPVRPSTIGRIPETKRRPPPFGPSAALVLGNIARLQGGRALLRPHILELCDAVTHNPSVAPYVDGVLAEVDSGRD